MLYNSESSLVSLWYNDQDHMHDGVKPKEQLGMNYITKKEIEKLFKNKVTMPSRILSALRNIPGNLYQIFTRNNAQ